MNKNLKIIVLFIAVLPLFASGQELQWKVNLNYFFDNTEFAKSTLSADQTMAGVHFAPEIGVKFDENQSVFGGMDLLKKSGSVPILDKAKLIAYYQFKNENTFFQAGAFPRGELLSNYSSVFFQDSINFYRPVMEGLYFKKGNENEFINLWMDWTGMQTNKNRETFFLGASGYKSFKTMFFGEFQSYMFHFAGVRPADPYVSVNDYVQGQFSVGAKYSNDRGLNNLMFSAGVLASYERDRQHIKNYGTPVGAVIRLNADYKGIGTENTVYIGQPRMVLYYRYGNELYWGNPFYRSTNYIENKIYWNFIENQYVKGQIASKMHYTEGKLMFEQLFTLSASIGSDNARQKRATIFDWFLQRRNKPKHNFNL